jgi:hypothetical protein
MYKIKGNNEVILFNLIQIQIIGTLKIKMSFTINFFNLELIINLFKNYYFFHAVRIPCSFD